ncbi:MAG: RtcB family protein, partial [Anaerolineaceae bacterium]|nr:RtcB family protein [Anaerolineaceae bacterium]
PMIDIQRIDENTLLVPRQGRMLTEATVFARRRIPIEQQALEQLCDAAGIDPQARVLATPDIHSGYGVPIGCVWASRKFISAAAVGYDINCGMRLLTTPLQADEVDVRRLADSIRRDIPLGEGQRNVELPHGKMLRFLARGVAEVGLLSDLNPRFAEAFDGDELADDLLRIEDGGCLEADPSCVPERAVDRGRIQFGTLGGGNHFIELQRVDRIFDARRALVWGLAEGQLVVMIHSGSRGLGHEVAGRFMKRTLLACQQKQMLLPSRQLSYAPLDSELGHRYHEAMKCAANFAYANRQVMATLLRHNVRMTLGKKHLAMPLVYDVAHNIAKLETVDGRQYCLHRKGATRAFPPSLMSGTPFAETGQPVLIPGSMGTASYLLAGIESGKRSLYSVNHGAGRLMSRTEAAGVNRRGKTVRPGAISDEAFAASMEGVYLVCRNRRRIKEEAPGAYKDIEVVIDTVEGAGLAARVARMRPLAVLKG